MSADTPPKADESELSERIRELEETVAQQQEHLERMMPSRRQALKAGGAALAGVSIYGAGAASAGTNQVGTIGTASSPVDVQAEDIVSKTVKTDEGIIKSSLKMGYGELYPHWPRDGEYSGPLSVNPHPRANNPVLTASDVTDVSSPDFVADPSLVYDDSSASWYLFFEVGASTNVIAYASSQDGVSWTYESTVISESVNMSYAQTFKYGGTWYMMPTAGSSAFEPRIYQADSFPSSWSYVETPISGDNAVDATIFKYNNKWWIISADNSTSPYEINVYYADKPIGGSWSAHPSNPVAKDAQTQRPGGRPLFTQGGLRFFYQDWSNTGSEAINEYLITTLNTSSFSQTRVGNDQLITQAQNGQWNDSGMHTIDVAVPDGPQTPMVAVDGRNSSNNWSLGIYTVGDTQNVIAQAAATSNQSISNSSFTTVNLNTLAYDPFKTFNLANDQFVAPATGYYDFSGAATLDASTNGFRFIGQIKNVTTGQTIARDNQTVGVATRQSANPNGAAYLNEGDAVELQIWQDSGGSESTIAVKYNTYLQAERVR